ncbi:hypothetical protein EU545_01420 [Candidatus Thorarchaeota archaeon]|nr:MAG: hypothetical protein EU545_01420 [Candidatus Thorarchaeota archaeon]
MSEEETCSWLRSEDSSHYCELRKQALPKAEVNAKCVMLDRAVICIDGYSSLFKGKELAGENSTEAILWFIESATQFENLSETDNAILACIQAVEFATKNGLIERAYEVFRYGRSVYEKGMADNDPALSEPALRTKLVKAGEKMIAKARELSEDDDVRVMQAELKAAVLGGAALKKVKKDDTEKKLVVVDGRELYAKKSKEYKEGADTFIASGVVQNAVTFACLGGLADLMLGRPKEGISYLTETAANSGFRDRFNESTCFKWAKLIFRAHVSKNEEAIDEARKLFLKFPWSFRDDKEFARRIMDSVYRRVTG